MICLPFPPAYGADFSVLYRFTNLDGAESILASGEIYGKDTSGHANFSVKPNCDLARGSDVLLEFSWGGCHKACFGSNFDLSMSIGCNGTCACHVFPDGPPSDMAAWNPWKDSYWQTNIYNGAIGLVFQEIQFHGPIKNTANPVDQGRIIGLQQLAVTKMGTPVRVVKAP